MNRLNPFLNFLFIGVILSILFSSGQIENPDTHLRLTQARILLENGKLGIPKDVGEDSHGNIAINQDGERFMVYNLGQTAIFIPIYLLATLTSDNEGNIYYNAAFIVSFINLIIHALCCLLLYKIAILLGATKFKSYFVALVFCLTSYSFSFAQSTYEHHFEMFFILLSYYYILSTNTRQSGLLAGIAITLGLIFRSTSILAIPGLLFLATNKQRLYFTFSTIPGILIILGYNYFRFGNPFESGYNIAWQLTHGNDIKFWSLSKIPQSLYGLLFSPAKGLIFFSPTIILSFFAFKIFWQKHTRITLSIILLCFLYLIIFSMNFAWHGSIWSFGPRYILPILPLLYLPIIEIKIKNWFYHILVIAFLSQVLLMSVNYKRNLLEQTVLYNGIDENQYINDFGNIPYLVQLNQLVKIVPKNTSATLKNYYPDSPWKRETRAGTGNQVLDYSIEKNSINFWWIRIFHLNTTFFERTLTIILLLGAILGTYLIVRNAKPNNI